VLDAFLCFISSVKWKKTGTGRIEMLDYPAEAVHKAPVNAKNVRYLDKAKTMIYIA
jgi:hypothetical protein